MEVRRCGVLERAKRQADYLDERSGRADYLDERSGKPITLQAKRQSRAEDNGLMSRFCLDAAKVQISEKNTKEKRFFLFIFEQNYFAKEKA